MFPVIPSVIGQGWERHEFMFKVSVLPNMSRWQLSGGEPHPNNDELVARWCVEADSLVGIQNAFLLSLSSKVFCPERRNAFAIVFIHFRDPSGKVMHGFRKKWCYHIEREERFLFSRIQWIPEKTTMLVTFLSETGLKPGFTDILLSDAEMTLACLPCEEESLTRTNRYCYEHDSHSRDVPDITGNAGSKLWIGKWEKFKFIFHSFETQSIPEIEPKEVIVKDSILRWSVKLKSEMDARENFHFLVTVQLLSSIERVVYAKVSYVVERKGSLVQKQEFSYAVNVDRTASHILKNICDIKNTVIKVSIVSDTGNQLRQLCFPNPLEDDIQTKPSDQSSAKQEAHIVQDKEEQTARVEATGSSDPVLVEANPSENVQLVAIGRVDREEPTTSQRLEHEAELQIVSSNMIGDAAGPSYHNDYKQNLIIRQSNNIMLSEPQVSSSSLQDEQCETFYDIPSSPERDCHLKSLEKWKKQDHVYSVPDLERFLYLYTIKMTERFSSFEQNLRHQSEPRGASSSWDVKMESSLCGDSKMNFHIVATLKKSKMNFLFARVLVFVYHGMDETDHFFEKKQCLCVGERIVEDLQNISILTNITLIEIVIFSEDPYSVSTHSYGLNVQAARLIQNPIQPVFIESSTDVLKAYSSVLCDCSPILKAILENFEPEDPDKFINMSEFSSKVVQSALDFMNGDDEIDWKRKKAEQIFRLSAKFCISDLKEKCESHLMYLLNVTNALELLVFAVDNSAERLKNMTLELVASENDYFCVNNGYSALHSRPEIMLQILEYLGSRRASKERRRENDSHNKKKKKRRQ